MAKPVVVLSGTLTNTDTFSSFLPFNNPYTSIINSTMLQDKLRGYLGFRATTVYRIVVNANRFQQGRYNLSYVATGGADVSESGVLNWVQDHISTLVQRTTLPHVEIDLCCDTEATLRIPFHSALNFCPVATILDSSSYGTLGMCYFYPYEKLAAGSGNLACGFTIYAHFEDVQLVAAALPQSGRLNSSKKSRKNETEVEQDSVGIGPISSSLIRVRDVANIFAKVPLLSSYATTVSWFSDIGASAAKVFGWSKPVNLKFSERVTQNYLPYAANTDGPDESFPLSLCVSNSVGNAIGFSGTNVDEMDFSFLATIPAWSNSIPWGGEAAGTSLYNSFVSPSVSIHTTTVNSSVFNHYIPYQFLATHFTQWRGSIVYKIKIVKTEFHSGRLSVTFSPFNPQIASVGAPTLATSPYVHRQILDIREANEFTFVVPFISVTPYKKTSNTADGYTGNFTILVLEPLVAPSNVSSSVTIIIEKAAGPDFELAIPELNPITYYSGIVPQMSDPFVTAPTVCSNFDGTIGTSLVKSDNSVNALHCIGEKISSIRTLLKLPHQLIATTPLLTNLYFAVLPYGISSGNVLGAVNTAPTTLNDFYSRFASCYTYSRGGVRLKFLDETAVTSPNPICIYIDTRDVTLSLVQSASATAPNGASTAIINRAGMPIVYYKAGYSGEVQVPQYGQFHSRLNSDCCAGPNNNYTSGGKSFAPSVTVVRQMIPNLTSTVTVLRSLSDDGNFGCFLSVPPMFGVIA